MSVLLFILEGGLPKIFLTFGFIEFIDWFYLLRYVISKMTENISSCCFSLQRLYLCINLNFGMIN